MPSSPVLWGALGGAALVLGAAIAWFFRVPVTIVSAVMAFGAGVLLGTAGAAAIAVITAFAAKKGVRR